MTKQHTLNVDAIHALNHVNSERLQKLSPQQRGELIIAACRAAATIEVSRLKMGMSPTQPAPWPTSTWKFLAEAARRVRN